MRNRRGGFTIFELLVVMAVIAILSTLATGAAIKAIRHGRQKRIEAMCKALEMALTTYRAQKGEWPFDMKNASTNRTDLMGWEKDKHHNINAFGKLYETGEASHRYLDCSGFFTIYKGKRMRLSEVPEGQRKECPIGYPDPADLSFRVFGVVYNRDLDTVEVIQPPRSEEEYKNWKEKEETEEQHGETEKGTGNPTRRKEE